MEALKSGTEIKRIANRFVTPSRGGRLHYHCIMRKIWPELMPRKVTLSIVSTEFHREVASYISSVYPLITISLCDEAGTLFVLETSQTSEKLVISFNDIG
ncbi:hypothetical protein PISMIDRAFT_686877 [Pisolithus microcarpus 441]|uniref:Uncharacterized protein n=1 Tax=Pisolithus microcarpus 441 TaxID=765257 RepID=A0A0C9Z7T8_9AGAM|nr:hypothetical protein PISMIDRAFT_686877 [Pisolithus microcarpus 441]